MKQESYNQITGKYTKCYLAIISKKFQMVEQQSWRHSQSFSKLTNSKNLTLLIFAIQAISFYFLDHFSISDSLIVLIYIFADIHKANLNIFLLKNGVKFFFILLAVFFILGCPIPQIIITLNYHYCNRQKRSKEFHPYADLHQIERFRVQYFRKNLQAYLTQFYLNILC